jgi:protein SCO1/2
MSKGPAAKLAAWAMLAWLAAGMALPLPGMAQEAGKMEVEGVTEKLGGELPMDATFKDQNGKTVTLGEVMTRPTVLAFIFFRCAGICPRLLSGVSDVVNRMPLEPGKDYQIVCISFDPTDQPAEAMRKQREYFALLKKPMPQGAWLFLTGDEENIHKVTDAAGFSYQKDGDMFIHPTTLIVASPHGKIVQYLYGVTYVPSALQMALANAGRDKVGGRVIGALLSCFSNQPKGNAIVSRVLMFTGAAVLLCAGAFVVFLVVTDPKRKAKRMEAKS